MPNDDFHITKAYIRAALTQARLVAGREIVFREDGITISDARGGKHHLNAMVAVPAPDKLAEGLSMETPHSYFQPGRHAKEISLSGHDNWKISEKDGVYRLKIAKNRHAALESVVSANPSDLADLRSLYDTPDVEITVMCEGETRTRDVALAFAAELNLSGHDTKLELPPVYKHDYWRDRLETSEDQEGSGAFETIKKAGQKWVVKVVSKDVPKMPPEKGLSRVIIREDARMASVYAAAHEGIFVPSRRLNVAVGVTLVDSKAVAPIAFSREARAAMPNAPKTGPSPWDEYNAQKAKRLSSRPSVLKTWHQTSDQVARAFVERQAPRGYISGKSLYFHGPVAYSLYDANPIAAFVDTPRGQTILFTGRNSGIYGTTAGTVSGADGDISRAAHERFPSFHVGELTDFLDLGGHALDRIAFTLRNKKNEAEYPSGCSVDPAKLEFYLLRRRKAADIELERVLKSSVATYTKSAAWGEMASIARFRNEMSSIFGINLPDMGDVVEFNSNAAREYAAAEKRQSELRERQRTKADELALHRRD